MRFTNGYWLIRDGIEAHFAQHAYEVEQQDNALIVFAPDRLVQNRGDTLNRPLLTVRYSSPSEGIIKVRISHFEGTIAQGPHFDLFEDPHFSPEILITDSEAVLRSGELSVHVARGSTWNVSWQARNSELTKSETRSTGYMVVRDSGPFIKEELSLGVGDCVYGLGERFGPFVKNGQTVDIWQADGGTASEQAYKNIPFYLTNAGYGVFVNSSGPVSFEIASEKTSRVQYSIPGETLEYYIIYGPDPKSILTRYTLLTGRPAVPPEWTFGLWLSTSFTTSYDEQTVLKFIDGMRQRTIPLTVFHFDCFWMKGFHWTDLVWDSAVFPDPAALLARIKDKGLKISVWINPYIAQRSKLFEEGKKNGYFLKKRDGSVWQTDLWQAGMAIVDFSNPEACTWFTNHLGKLLDMGVDCFKTDFGERIPTDVVYYDGSDPLLYHNYYTFQYNKTVFNYIERKKGSACVFARSATVGSQQFPVHWGGDCESTFVAMAETLRGGLSLGISGFGFWSHDIGGFEGNPDPALFKRWLAFGLLSSHSRLHGSNSYRVPWNVDAESVEVCKFFTDLKATLLPYILKAANEAHEKGIPVLRAMLLEFSEDPACYYLDNQYMFGESLLVAPVFRADGSVSYYLPTGVWTNYFTGEAVEGGSWRTETHTFLSLPLWIRAGADIKPCIPQSVLP
ncbi:MAG: alpha-xylosidase [Treponema sp.]|jgi:alpha-D-xyloside xylohydrolase|nr:alpha-xylosidase [Treponema sp.]